MEKEMQRSINVRERQRLDWLLLKRAPTGDRTRNPGMCSDWESSQQPFTLQNDAQPTEPHQPGPDPSVLTFLENSTSDFCGGGGGQLPIVEDSFQGPYH